jgi:hypothetical protein
MAVNKDNDGMPIRAHDDPASDEARPKLKPLHWDKVRACSDRDMVWDRLKSNSFQLRYILRTETRLKSLKIVMLT